MDTNNSFIKIYDTTLRDGSQAEGVSFSKVDKIRIAQLLDDFGVSYIEGGWPGSNPRDIAFFEEAKKMHFHNAKIAAFGSTRRSSNKVEKDDNIIKLLQSETPVVTIFGKSWILHVDSVLKISPDENLNIIGDSCGYLHSKNKEVVFDAEHFFDGYKDNPSYAIDVIKKASENGASTIVLCDTNGGTLTSEIYEICTVVRAKLNPNIILGIHCHNDSELAVANSLTALKAGVKHIQGTINGFGERCGNANLCSIIPAIELKMGQKALCKNNLHKLREVSSFVDELANIPKNKRLPYVGESSFAHKGGMHVNAVSKNPSTFEHIEPSLVGSKRRILVSDLSGKSNIMMKLSDLNIDNLSAEELTALLNRLKELENEGYEFEAADASFCLLMKKIKKEHEPFFTLDGFRVIVEKRGNNEPCISEATVKVNVKGEIELSAAEGDGPVNALDNALRKSLIKFYPELSDVKLKDYKVRIMEGDNGTAAKTRVLIESGSDTQNWGTVGVSENIIEASWEALVDSVEYGLYTKQED